MTLFELIVILMASPLIIVLFYGTYRFYVDPEEGETPAVKKPRKTRTTEKPSRTVFKPKTAFG